VNCSIINQLPASTFDRQVEDAKARVREVTSS
jgi:hypothetical protein